MPSPNMIIVPKDSLIKGYEYTIENAIRLLNVATQIKKQFPDKSLALAQLGQEEIGKSLTILAAFHLPDQSSAWAWFWKGWKSHVLKAHRAYLYEVIHPLRIVMKAPDGSKYDGLPLRNPITKEKESGLYVNFDEVTKQFLDPSNEVKAFDATARISTLFYLSALADAVKRALFYKDVLFRMKEFSFIAFKICSENVYQQDMPKIIDQFSSISKKHSKIIKDLNVAMQSVHMLFEKAGKKVLNTQSIRDE